MQVLVDENNNKIYGDLSLQDSIKIHFGNGFNNTVFFAGKSRGGFQILFGGYNKIPVSNSLVFIGDNSTLFAGDLNIFSDCVFYVGRNTDMGNSYFWLSDCQNCIIGDDTMMSWELWFRTTDQHMIYENEKNQRVNFGKSIFIGDHVWGGFASSFMKGVQAFSGSIIGNASIITAKKFYSNTINAGNPCKERKKEVFWTRTAPDGYNKLSLKEFDKFSGDDFKFSFEKDKFLNPSLLDKSLSSLNTAYEKLEFVYDYIYNNTHKNRFALFENSDFEECKLYKDESKMPFKELKFENYETKEKQINPTQKPNGAVLRVKNQLCYKLGNKIINAKTFKERLTLPFRLYVLVKEHRFESKIKEFNIKNGLMPRPLKLEEYSDYKEALKVQNHLSYKLGKVLTGGGIKSLVRRLLKTI